MGLAWWEYYEMNAIKKDVLLLKEEIKKLKKEISRLKKGKGGKKGS